jgi:PIN domain nuclease of toxin-antitoxin system
VRALVDTHVLLWFASGDRRLSAAARAFIEADDAEPVISAACVWEMAVKAGLGKLDLPMPVDDYVAAQVARGYRTLSVTAAHAAAVEELPWHHRDPFDRMLVAQALLERVPIATRDPVFKRYGVTTIW